MIHAVIGYILLYFLVAICRIDAVFALLLTFVLVVALALLIHYFVEAPSQKLGKIIAMQYSGLEKKT